MSEATVRAAFAAQAGYCEELGSAFTARLCRLIGERLDGGTMLGRAVLGWPGDPGAQRDALPLRLAGGLHALARGHAVADLEAVYPPHAPASDEDLWVRLEATFAQRGPALVAALASPPQTNEVRRSALIMAGLAVIATETGLDLEINELGTSAGLNLLPHRYDIRLGDCSFGVSGSPVKLAPEWTGPSPPGVQPKVTRVQGVDLNPLHVGRAEDRERLLSYIWADQADRIARTVAAIALASIDPPTIVAGDAAEWLEGRLQVPQPTGTVRVVTHTIAAQYFPTATRARIGAALDRSGRTATAAAPLARLGFELPPEAGPAELWLTLWPGGQPRRLATADPHGRRITWVGGVA